jgi:hypothetical protein
MLQVNLMTYIKKIKSPYGLISLLLTDLRKMELTTKQHRISAAYWVWLARRMFHDALITTSEVYH